MTFNLSCLSLYLLPHPFFSLHTHLTLPVQSLPHLSVTILFLLPRKRHSPTSPLLSICDYMDYGMPIKGFKAHIHI